MVLLITALAVALRVAWVLLVPTKPVGDFAMYVESAAHLVAHGSLDPEYVYMPGYVFLIAPVQALGGGWLATKLVGAVLGGLGAGAVAGIGRAVAGGSARVGAIAGLLCALWPAGIAVASVTGTDMPAAALVAIATYLLFRFAGPRPLMAALLFGLGTGLGAYIRAIVVPLAGLSVLVFRATGAPWRRALVHAALACSVALLVLAPWAVRNRVRYGETFFTDSHGGLTALVGANPNTDGCYSRSLNRMFRDITGYTLLVEPHRAADRAALGIAKAWTTFDPWFTLGLLTAKAERLLLHERALLYWPLFRAGALPEPDRSFFARHQAAIEAVADAFWLGVLALSLMGAGLAYARRQWLALCLLPSAAVLVVLYAAIFSEPRYRMPICMLLLPLSALAVVWLVQTGRRIVARDVTPSWRREAIVGCGLPVLVFVASAWLAHAGQQLRVRHRFAIHECHVAGQPRFCAWRTFGGHAAGGQTGVRGVWNGVGVALPGGSPEQPASLTAETELAAGPGNYTLRMNLDHVGAAPSDGTTITVVAAQQTLAPPLRVAELPSTASEEPRAWQAKLHHPGGTVRLRVLVESKAAIPGRVWLGNVRLEPDAP